jgi:uroporphyrinogen decarboxylase
MDKRERVLRAVEMRKPDRCPIMHSVLPAAFFQHREGLIELLGRYPNDFGSSDHKIPEVEDLAPSYRSGINRDAWGIVWNSSVSGIHGQVAEHPIKNPEDAEKYEFPAHQTDEAIQKAKRDVAEEKKDRFVMNGYNPGNYFERLHFLLGFREVLKYLVNRPTWFVDFADRLLEFSLESIERTLEARPDCVNFGDDWGAQDRLLINPEIWRSFFKPRYKKMFDMVHDGGAFVHFHTDGHIIAILDDLHEIGIDILNPQFSCHELEDFASKTRGRFCINSDVDRQVVLPHYSPDRLKAHIKRVVDLFGRQNNGGLFGRAELNMDVPLENVEALFDAWLKFGKYEW